MRKLKIYLTLFLVVLSFAMCSCQNNNRKEVHKPEVTGSFSFDVLKVGQADAIIMKTQNHSIIIDLGEKDDGDEIVQYLKEHNIESVDYLFITHFDKDHVGGFPFLIQNVTIGDIYVPDYEGTSDEYIEYIKTVEENNLPVTVLKENIEITVDDVLFEVLPPKKVSYAEGDNDFSLVISAMHGDNTFLFTGDAEADRIPEILSEFGRSYDFLKVPHHGKYNKNTKRLVNTIKPHYSVICDSEKNPASDKTVSLLESAKSEIFTTKNGNVSVLSNGKEINITQ